MSPGDALSQRPCFIVSTGRCGSNMIARVLDLHRDIAAFHEPEPHLVTEAYLRWAGEVESGYVHECLSRKRDKRVLAKGDEGCTYVESSHYLSHLIPELRERYDGRFVHLYRDGRDFTRSGLEREWYEDPGLSGRLKTWLRRRVGVQVGTTFRDHRLGPPPDMTTRFEKTAWLWVEINRVILSAIDRVPEEDVMAIRLEAFGQETIQDLLVFMGYEATDELVVKMHDEAESRPNQTVDRTVPPKEDWEQTTIERFWEIAGPMMERLGYRDE